MIKKVFILLFIVSFASPLFSQRVVTLIPQESSGDRTKWTTVAAGVSTTFEFRFSQNKSKNPYSGWVSVVTWADTSSGALPDSVTESANPKFYDIISDQWEISAGRVDSLDIEDNFDLTVNHSDNVYSISKALNVLAADGIQINFYNNDSSQGVKIRVELRLVEIR